MYSIYSLKTTIFWNCYFPGKQAIGTYIIRFLLYLTIFISFFSSKIVFYINTFNENKQLTFSVIWFFKSQYKTVPPLTQCNLNAYSLELTRKITWTWICIFRVTHLSTTLTHASELFASKYTETEIKPN